MAFLEGLGVGIALMFITGPVFFTLLQAALQHGFKNGFAVATGIIVSDVLCVLLCAYGTASFFKNPDNQLYIGLLGALILIAFGIKFLTQHSLTANAINVNVNVKENKSVKNWRYFHYFSSGFIVNFVNPVVFLIWIGIINNAGTRYGYNQNIVIYLSATLLGIYATDTLKAAFAHKIKPLLNARYLPYIYKGIGILLIGFAARMLYEAILATYQ